MPTGYTAAVQDGSITELPDFAMQCARAMGVLVVMMRDDPLGTPIPERFEPDDYYAKAAARYRQKCAELLAMTPEERQADFERWDAKRRDERVGRVERNEEHAAAYAAMLSKVEAWQPPTPDHQGLKDFMLQQLKQSIDFDCGGREPEPVEEIDAATYFQQQVEHLRTMADRSDESHAEEIERTDRRNAWLRQLRESLGLVPVAAE